MMSTAELDRSFARMNLQQGHVPAKGQATVHVLTPEQQRVLNARVDQMIDSKQKIATLDAKIVKAQAEQVEAKKEMERGKVLEEKAKTQAAQATANRTAHTAQVVKGLDGMAAALFKMQEVQQANPASVKKIEELRQRILCFKDNLPKDPAAMDSGLKALQQEGMALRQNLNKL